MWKINVLENVFQENDFLGSVFLRGVRIPKILFCQSNNQTSDDYSCHQVNLQKLISKNFDFFVISSSVVTWNTGVLQVMQYSFFFLFFVFLRLLSITNFFFRFYIRHNLQIITMTTFAN